MIEITDKRPDRSVVKEYEEFKPILDRILVQRIEPDKVEDGFIVPEKYRQSESVGEVLAIGDCIVLGKEILPLTNFIKVGDRIRYGEYTSEVLSINDPGKFIVRLQDVRGIWRSK